MIEAHELKAWRRQARLTQHRAARYLGVATRTYENWEQGHRKPSNPGAIRKLMKLRRMR
jgi:DNA-binding transcriptional regulator YiaG